MKTGGVLTHFISIARRLHAVRMNICAQYLKTFSEELIYEDLVQRKIKDFQAPKTNISSTWNLKKRVFKMRTNPESYQTSGYVWEDSSSRDMHFDTGLQIQCLPFSNHLIREYLEPLNLF